jgi:hypothetical protein
LAILDGLNDIPTKIGALGHDLAPVTGFAGFMYGVNAKWKFANPGSYPFSTQGIYDTIAGVFGKNALHSIFPNAGGVADRTFNLGAVFNTGTYAAAGIWALHELMPNKWTKLAKDVALAPLLGYGIGRIFDDPMSPNVDYTTAQNPNYAGGGYRAPMRGSAPFLASMGQGHGMANSWGGITATSSTGTWAGVRGSQWG